MAYVLLSGLFNLGLTMSLTFGALILIRPLTNRFFRPRQRVMLWYLGWYGVFVFHIYSTFHWLPAPFSFRAFLSARTVGNSYALPAFLPIYDGPGRYNLSLPGNTIVPVTLTDSLVAAVIIFYVIGLVAVILWSWRQKRRLRALEQTGEAIDRAQLGLEVPELKTCYFDRVEPKIYLCDNLPTSYVRNHFWSMEYFIYLQRDLSPERMALVFRHEVKHMELNHVYYKSIAHWALVIFWWSPLVWLAFRLMCRDMELACDEAVMDDLDETGRREYARAIVELGAGRPLWESVATFGECDAALRARRAADWKKAGIWTKILSWTMLVLLFLFFYCGAPAGDGTLAADLPLQAERSAVVTIRPGVNVPDKGAYPSSGELLRLTEIWRVPETMQFYGLGADGVWYGFYASWSEQEGEYLAILPLDLRTPPDLTGLERIK